MSVDNMALIASIIGVLLPIILVIVAVKKSLVEIKHVGFGALAYLLIFALSSLSFLNSVQISSIGLVLIAALVTKLFDTVVRYGILRFATRKDISLDRGISFGLGFGAMQIFVGTGVTFGIAALIMKFNISASGNEMLLATQENVLNMAQANPMVFITQIILIPFVIALEIGISVMIMKSIVDKSYKYFFLAFGFQTFIQLMIGYMGMLSPVFADFMIALAGIFGWYMVNYLRRENKEFVD